MGVGGAEDARGGGGQGVWQAHAAADPAAPPAGGLRARERGAALREREKRRSIAIQAN